MPRRLSINRVTSASQLSGALLPGAAADHGDYDADAGILTVENRADASALVENHRNVSWADGDPPATCQEVKTDGEVCGRDLPCRYHS